MRQRYYNPEIKRFINRDVVTGTLGNSQSLNRYSYVQGNPISLTDPFGLSPINGLFSGGSFNLGGLLLAGIHTALDVAGSGVGIISTVANAVNAVLYAAVDKDYAMAALSAVSAISLGAGNIAKLVGKGSFGAATIRVTGNIISGMTNFGVNASMAVDIADQMLDKYVWGDQEFGEEGKAELLFLALSVYGGLNSVAVAMHNAKQLGNMMKCVDEQSKELEYLIKQLSNSQVKASEGSSNTKDIYRAVGVEEYEDIIATGKFRGIEGKTLMTKEFGNDFNETLEFANKSINKDKVAIFKVTIPENIYNQLNHMNLDPSIFKSGTPVVEPEMLDFFNNSIINIEHFF